MTTSNTELQTPYRTIGHAIRELRIKNGWTQLQLGKKVNRLQSTVASYECDRITPSLKVLTMMAIEFRVPLPMLTCNRRSISKNPKHGP